MKPILIVYATREGHTHRIADHVSAQVCARGTSAEVIDARDARSLVLDDYSGIVLAASLHLAKYEPEMIRFVRDRRASLEKVPTAFLSVSLTEAGAEDQRASVDSRAHAREQVEATVQAFFDETGWHPGRVQRVAGALLYTKYNLFLRFVMKQIARKAGGSTDTSRDHEYTDWVALDRFVDGFMADLENQAA
jgi:menaquinone-dependent protoporphyrinogen oxidase